MTRLRLEDHTAERQTSGAQPTVYELVAIDARVVSLTELAPKELYGGLRGLVPWTGEWLEVVAATKQTDVTHAKIAPFGATLSGALIGGL